MNRRGFLKLLGAAAPAVAAASLLPELLIPKRTFFLPPAGGWRGSTMWTTNRITQEALKILHEKMTFEAWGGGGSGGGLAGNIVTFETVNAPGRIVIRQPKQFVVRA